MSGVAGLFCLVPYLHQLLNSPDDKGWAVGLQQWVGGSGQSFSSFSTLPASEVSLI